MFNKKFSRRDFIKRTTLAALALSVPSFFFGNEKLSAADKNCTVRTRHGIYNGFVGKGGVRTWLGIPYAKPPVGNLRWQSPEELPPSDSEFDAKEFGLTPIQDRDPVEPASLNPQGEDCLTLNIWTRGDKKNLPVMFFIPGGGFVSGGSADPTYNGAKLAAGGNVVVVTINYRLNVFGFMNFAGIDPAYESSGYLGIQDQVAALTWVRENISEFGGDPDNVTVFGESAGSISASLLMTAPVAKGLFQKVIAQSGHADFYHEPKHSAELAEEFMSFNGLANMGELMKKSSAEIEEIYEKFCWERSFMSEIDYFPTCDGKFLPLNPLKALKDGAGNGVKLMTGTTADEYRYWLLYYKNFLTLLNDFHARITPVFYEQEFSNRNQLYLDWQKNHKDIAEDVRYLEFANQLDWRVGQELEAEYQSAFDDVYFYLFSQTSPVGEMGSCHSIDLPFVFNNPSENIEPRPSAKFAKQVQAAWISFATMGNPNNALIPQWKPYTADDRETMEINSKAWTCRKDLNAQNLEELRHVYENTFLDMSAKKS